MAGTLDEAFRNPAGRATEGGGGGGEAHQHGSLGSTGFEPYSSREAARPFLGLGTSQGFVFVNEDYDQAYDEKDDHELAEEVVVAVDVEGREVQFGLRHRIPIISVAGVPGAGFEPAIPGEVSAPLRISHPSLDYELRPLRACPAQ